MSVSGEFATSTILIWCVLESVHEIETAELQEKTLAFPTSADSPLPKILYLGAGFKHITSGPDSANWISYPGMGL